MPIRLGLLRLRLSHLLSAASATTPTEDADTELASVPTLGSNSRPRQSSPLLGRCVHALSCRCSRGTLPLIPFSPRVIAGACARTRASTLTITSAMTEGRSHLTPRATLARTATTATIACSLRRPPHCRCGRRGRPLFGRPCLRSGRGSTRATRSTGRTPRRVFGRTTQRRL